MAASTSAPPGAQWFALHTLSGQEGKVKTYIEKFKKAEELDDFIFEVLLPTEVVSEVKGGKNELNLVLREVRDVQKHLNKEGKPYVHY